MPPARTRVTHDEQKTETSTSKDRNGNSGAGNGKGRKNGTVTVNGHSNTAKDSKSATQSTAVTHSAANQVHAANASIDWNTESTPLLQNYRSLYNIDTPAAFTSTMNTALLTMPGIGRQSPTMAARKRAKRNTPKDQLALTVRKHFNSLAVNETDVVVNFLYKVKTQDRAYKMRFGPSKK